MNKQSVHTNLLGRLVSIPHDTFHNYHSLNHLNGRTGEIVVMWVDDGEPCITVAFDDGTIVTGPLKWFKLSKA